MGKLYRLNWKLYLKTIYLPAVYLLLLGYGVYQFVTFSLGLPAGRPLMSFQDNLTGTIAQLGTLCFTFFLFEAYEFLHKSADRDLRESLRSTNSGERKTVASQLLVLLGLVLLTFLLAVVAVLITAQSINPMSPAALGNAMLAVTLYLLCPMLIAVLLGAVGALCISRLPFYFLALLMVFLTSEFSDVFTMTAGFQAAGMLGIPFGIFVIRLTGLFRNLTLGTFILSDMAYGLSVEPFHWALVLFWVGLCLALLCWMLRRRKGLLMRVLSGIFAAVCAFGLWGYANPGSNWRLAIKPSVEYNANSDFVYYSKSETNAQQNETKPAGFSVTDYVLDLSFWKDLSATATLTLDGIQLPEYDFTLYHGYTVRSVTDGEGNLLSYERWHDYLRVKAPEGAALNTVRIVYDGYHQDYYSSAQGAFLPGFFPYYPMEGLFPVMEEGDIYYTIPAQKAERNFTIQVNSSCEAFSNLSGKDGNTLTGKAKYLTVVAGMYEEKDFEGDHIIAPYGTCLLYTSMLLRHAGKLEHGSVDGAEYLDGYYVYDELINPYQEWLDKGWELYITPDPVFEDDEEWNGQGDPPPVDKWGEYKGYSGLSCYTFWYDKEGNVYDVYGDLFTKLDDPSHRLTRSEILDIRNQNAIGTIVFDSTISVIANPGGNSTIIELDSPIDSITIGTSGTNNAGAG